MGRLAFAGRRRVLRRGIHERHFFVLEPPPRLPKRWAHLAEEGNGDFWFEFSWVALTPDLELAGDQHAFLKRLGQESR